MLGGSGFVVAWPAMKTPEIRTVGGLILILAVPGQCMYEDEQLSLDNACIAQWYRARLTIRHALVQLGQKRISVRR